MTAGRDGQAESGGQLESRQDAAERLLRSGRRHQRDGAAGVDDLTGERRGRYVHYAADLPALAALGTDLVAMVLR